MITGGTVMASRLVKIEVIWDAKTKRGGGKQAPVGSWSKAHRIGMEGKI